MVRLGREFWSWTDYILGVEFRLFRNVLIWDPMHNLDHYLILGYIRSSTLREHTKYLGRLMRIPHGP